MTASHAVQVATKVAGIGSFLSGGLRGAGRGAAAFLERAPQWKLNTGALGIGTAIGGGIFGPELIDAVRPMPEFPHSADPRSAQTNANHAATIVDPATPSDFLAEPEVSPQGKLYSAYAGYLPENFGPRGAFRNVRQVRSTMASLPGTTATLMGHGGRWNGEHVVEGVPTTQRLNALTHQIHGRPGNLLIASCNGENADMCDAVARAFARMPDYTVMSQPAPGDTRPAYGDLDVTDQATRRLAGTYGQRPLLTPTSEEFHNNVPGWGHASHRMTALIRQPLVDPAATYQPSAWMSQARDVMTNPVAAGLLPTGSILSRLGGQWADQHRRAVDYYAPRYDTTGAIPVKVPY